MSTILVDVTQADIDTARQASEWDMAARCPIAQALRRIFPDATDVFVGYPSTRVETPTEKVALVTSKAASAFMSRFDLSQGALPRRFRLTVLVRQRKAGL